MNDKPAGLGEWAPLSLEHLEEVEEELCRCSLRPDWWQVAGGKATPEKVAAIITRRLFNKAQTYHRERQLNHLETPLKARPIYNHLPSEPSRVVPLRWDQHRQAFHHILLGGNPSSEKITQEQRRLADRITTFFLGRVAGHPPPFLSLRRRGVSAACDIAEVIADLLRLKYLKRRTESGSAILCMASGHARFLSREAGSESTRQIALECAAEGVEIRMLYPALPTATPASESAEAVAREASPGSSVVACPVNPAASHAGHAGGEFLNRILRFVLLKWDPGDGGRKRLIMVRACADRTKWQQDAVIRLESTEADMFDAWQDAMLQLHHAPNPAGSTG